MGKKIYKVKADNKNIKFSKRICLGSIFNKSGHNDSIKVSLKGSVYDFSVDCNAIIKSDICNG